MCRRRPGPPFEQPPEERRILVADVVADLVDRPLRGFEQALGLLDSQVLQVVDEREAGGLLEPPLQRPLGDAAVGDDPRNRTGFAIVLGQPVLADANRSVSVRLLADQWLI